jgi:ribonuclease J
MLLDHEKVRNWINFFNFELYGTLGRDREKSGFHASGHIHGPGIEELVGTVRSGVLIPVHTENREFFPRGSAAWCGQRKALGGGLTLGRIAQKRGSG